MRGGKDKGGREGGEREEVYMNEGRGSRRGGYIEGRRELE